MLLLLTAFLLLASLVSPPSSAAQQAAPGGKVQWRLTFDEEFRGHALDPRRWTRSEGTFENRSEPLQYFLPDAVSVGGGKLRITSRHQPSHGYKYTSGEIRTLDKFSQCYGRLEARCRFPKGYGSWSAVYLLPADESWPPEIDAAEFIGRSPQTIYLTNHWLDAAGEHLQANENWSSPTVDWSGWHTYTLEWQPDGVRWFVDGVRRGEFYGPVSQKPMYIRVNTSVGGVFAGPPHPGAWPQTLQVDYIRVYQSRGGPAPIFGPVPRFVPPPQPVPAAPISPAAPAPAGDDGIDTSGLVLDLSVMLLVWAAVWRRAGAKDAGTAALAAGACASALQYAFFRVQIISWAAWGIALPLLLAEAHGLLHTLGLQYTLWPRPLLPLRSGDAPPPHPVFVFIPTVNEGVAVLEPTLQGTLAARARLQSVFPDASVTVVICNDGFAAGYPQWRETEELAQSNGVTCITRPQGGGAKAGNIEWARQAVGATGNALLALFDADQIPEEEFLLQTLPPFTDPSVGWVQTGQYYRNLENPIARWANDQQALFYRVLCPGKGALNSAFICGTNVVIRAAALDEIGGLPQDCVTEDFAASLLLHPRWRSVFLTEVLATGLGPMDLRSYFAQQGRWAVGTLSTLRRRWQLLVLPGPGGLSPAQRVQYGLACTHYLSGLRDFVYLLVPFVFLLMGVSAITGTSLPAFLSHFLPYYLLSQIAFWRAAWGKTTLRGIALSFGSFPVLLASLLLVVFNQRVRFAVTPKRRVRSGRRAPLLAQSLAAVCCVIGLILAAAAPGSLGLTLFSALWLLAMLLLLAGTLWLGFQDRRRSSEEG